MCGENRPASASALKRAGSSPRVRGKRPGGGVGTVRPRLIPACAGKTVRGVCGRPGRGAHPRVCGENAGAGGGGLPVPGSSPRVRGKPPGWRPPCHNVGLIPACAGKTHGWRSSSPGSGAHPRVCGENRTSSNSPMAKRGSSPRVRGKPRRGHQRRGSARLIPARAGKTTGCSPRAGPRPAHPRACGENTPGVSHPPRSYGSSPRVRGKPVDRDLSDLATGLIPARAGKTSARAGSTGAKAAHPRACGENWRGTVTTTVLYGSSPRVRGKPCVSFSDRRGAGLIPARAGKTGPGRRPVRRPWAHPRACGENRTRGVWESGFQGSSPRVRGKRCRGDDGADGSGLIPARAGKTPSRRASSSPPRAHPRACGENPRPPPEPPHGAGSSPRVRGKRAVAPEVRWPEGLIPARAGKTVWTADFQFEGEAHPRACGENLGVGGVHGSGEGSSPRVRGKRLGVQGRSVLAGLIPARAGKTLPDLGFYRSGRSDLGNPRAFLLFWKLLIPGRPRKRRAASGASAGSVYWPRPWATAGRIMSRMPSKSTGRQGSPQVRNSRPCSLRAL